MPNNNPPDNNSTTPSPAHTRRNFLASAGLVAGAGLVGGAGSLAHGALTSPASAGPPGDPANWELVFSDDFNTFNTNRWVKRDRERPHGNNDVTWFYRAANVSVSNSNLVITTKSNGDGTFSAGNVWGLATEGDWGNALFSQTFGYFEARVKLPPAGRGHQGSFWMVGADGGHFTVGNDGRDGAEIDIMEAPYVSDHYHANLHWDGYEAGHRSAGAKISAPGIHSGYHVFGVEWAWNSLKYYYDNQLVRTYTGVGVPRVPEILQCSADILRWCEGDIRQAILPTYTYFDWVRVYKKSTPIVDNTSNDLTYSGTWRQMFHDSDYQGSMTQRGTAGSYVEHTFNGTSVAVAVRKSAWGGYVNVLVDGQVKLSNYDTYSSSNQYQQVIYQNNSLPAGQHTVRLVATGQARPGAQGTLAMFDYFQVS